MLVLAGLISGGSALKADVIYSTFGTGDSYATGTGILVTNDGLAWSSAAIAFTPSSNYTLSSIELVATDLIPNAQDSVTVGIFADNNGQPGGQPLESFTVGSLGLFGQTVLLTSVTSVLQPLLLANTQYWVGLDASPGALIVWNQNTSGATGFSESDGFGNWSTSDPAEGQGVVEIDGTLASVIVGDAVPQLQDSAIFTPEPRTTWLMAGGLAALAWFTRRAIRGALSVSAPAG